MVIRPVVSKILGDGSKLSKSADAINSRELLFRINLKIPHSSVVIISNQNANIELELTNEYQNSIPNK